MKKKPSLSEDEFYQIVGQLEKAARILDDVLGALDSITRIDPSRLMLGSMLSYPRGIEEKMKYKQAAMGIRAAKDLVYEVRRNQERLEGWLSDDAKSFERLLGILGADFDGMIIRLLQYKSARSIGLRVKTVLEEIEHVVSKMRQSIEKSSPQDMSQQN